MDKKEEVINMIVRQGVLPLFYHADPDISVQILQAMYRAGIKVVEYTNRGTLAWKNFIALRKIVDVEMPDMLLGAGTIKNKMSATEFINEGADFIISPGMVDDVADLADKNDLLWIPGCFTPTEIMHTEELGARLVKLFPGAMLGPAFVQSVREIFPNLLFIPTGGVQLEKENMQSWFRSGVSALGMGSNLIRKELVDREDFEAIESLAVQALALAEIARVS